MITDKINPYHKIDDMFYVVFIKSHSPGAASIAIGISAKDIGISAKEFNSNFELIQ
ncbi:hypothetical protein [Synechococcus sp. PCC 6312]|uniref:hypothetical protein n=1 Tax=Synechococcus sp. (strain ATCC 27167 / PCC 6312) TaxID=195253 RepID=UPI0002FCB55E|nr:hypothetical protein [Synechococcus sp. PCC 6312]